MSVEYTPKLPDDILTRIKYLNEQPDDYDVNTDQIISLKEEDIGKFRPPEPSLRVGVRDSSYLNYRAWGYISEDERILLSDEGEVYLKLDEETFGTNEALRMMFEIAQNPNLSVEKKMTNREIGLRKLISQQWQASVFSRILAWMKNGRLGK
ncbi:hypothetical protein N9K84_03365 [Candidatus Poseidoniales archaeon]|nr:hypothetical protein [Candidatus Poseidoniales archaeon]MDA8801703.1 hypothetical protein [Candidatus Poseidoniales archaeon]